MRQQAERHPSEASHSGSDRSDARSSSRLTMRSTIGGMWVSSHVWSIGRSVSSTCSLLACPPETASGGFESGGAPSRARSRWIRVALLVHHIDQVKDVVVRVFCRLRRGLGRSTPRRALRLALALRDDPPDRLQDLLLRKFGLLVGHGPVPAHAQGFGERNLGQSARDCHNAGPLSGCGRPHDPRGARTDRL